MIGFRAGLALGLIAGSSAGAQLRPSFSAAARLTEASVGPTDPAVWFGGRFDWSSPRLAFRGSAAGGSGWRGRLGGEVSALGRFVPELGRDLNLVAQLGGAYDRPIAELGAAEVSGRLGLARRFGPMTIEGGALFLGASRLTGLAGGGAYLGSALSLGPITFTGDVGQVAVLTGSLVVTSFGDNTTGQAADPRDTLTAGATSGTTSARRLSHALLGARIRTGPFEVYTRVLKRTRLELGETMGWEAGVAMGPIAGAKLRFSAGRMPAPETIYLPYRNQLTLGVELVGGRPHGDDERADRTVTFDVLVGDRAEPSTAARIVVKHPTAVRVEIAGDFSSWEPVQLDPTSSGTFEAALALGPGAHRINVRFDGGRWEVPPGLASTPDDFGGRTGVLVLTSTR